MRFLILCAVLMMMLLSTAHSADATNKFGEVGPWTISVDKTVGDGCFAVASWIGGAGFRVGFDNRDGVENIYVIVGHADWKSIEVGKFYDLEVTFGNRRAWMVRAEGAMMGDDADTPVLHFIITVKAFRQFMQEHGVNLMYKDRSIANLSLRDSYKAGQKMIECQKLLNEYRRKKPSSPDPFRSTSDPFAR